MTADPFDDASNLEEAHREAAIKSIRNVPRKVHLHCLTCNAPTNGKAYCSSSCKEEGEFLDRIQKIKGYR